MCYIVNMDQVGVRELKRNANAVLERVRGGQSVEVTDRGRAVAWIVPIPKPDDGIGRLLAEGLAKSSVGNLSDLPSPLRLPKGRLLPSEALAELGAGER